MKFSIVIYAAPYSSEAAATALRFSQAALKNGHEVYRLFFFGDGVHNASRLTVVSQDEKNIQQQWQQLIDEHKLDCVVCVSSAIKRGIVDKTESTRYEMNAVSAHENFEVAGLGQLIDATLNSDRVVNFG
ncbi:MAG: sulfurtransferase complex subunit TusD [SAR86 cluster bacterium]|uniref:Sulfurtransferase complex subunit TusD n=1 Tax=SAR86 cluster bacterium TaxID=2030880 RepID=A0A2A5B3G0_9GAMM|nr:MAG: sulfurtransferase complex subunit TusD [SAR86 cluster bacterium]